jgi:hypothetical protein
MLGAQEFGWRLSHAEGGNFALTTGGGLQSYAPGSVGAGIFLENESMLQTGIGQLELRYLPQAGAYLEIKAGENTSLLLHGETEGKATLELLYGRIRIRTANQGIVVVSGNTALEIREGDMGVDFEIPPGSSRPVFRVHGFGGSGELIPLIQEGFADITRLPVGSGESLTLEFHTPFSYVERRPLARDMVQYWNARAFSGGAPLPVPKDSSAVSMPELESSPDGNLTRPPVIEPDFPKGQAASGLQIKRKNFGIAAGLLLVAAGTAMNGLGVFGTDLFDKKTRDILTYSGYAPIGMGSLILLITLCYNPKDAPE